MKANSFGLSHVGQRRLVNEDAWVIDENLGLYAVADGMGGHAAGEIASQRSLEIVHNSILRSKDVADRLSQDPLSAENVQAARRLMESAIQNATYMVFAFAQHDPEQQGMGTTLSAFLLADRVALLGQVGDSRIYRVRNDQAHQLTEDHTLINWQLKQGLISPAEAERSPHKNVITRAVGSHDYVQVDTLIIDVQAGDKFLVCSDGLHGYLKSHEIPRIMKLSPENAAHEFIDMANNRGGRDNITAIVLHVGS